MKWKGIGNRQEEDKQIEAKEIEKRNKATACKRISTFLIKKQKPSPTMFLPPSEIYPGNQLLAEFADITSHWIHQAAIN